ncbi:MAG: porin family protein [Rhizobiales bacterium]|jgi:opacity protein-like surface antigen|nr:porin family protein [Hyphomicrobiales bacterium]
MTGCSKIMLAAAGLSLMPLAPALAADYAPEVVANQPAQFVPVEVGNGWYLRGDVGFAFSRDMGNVDYRTFDPVGGTYTGGRLDSASLNTGATYGIGFGYTFNPWVRTDITLDGSNTDFHGRAASTDPCGGAPADTTCNTTGSGSVTTLSLMANGYVDLGTYAGLTPYVGAGAGMSRVKWGGFTENTYCVDGAGTCTAALLGTTAHSGNTDYRFTYAFMAGLAYDISQNLKLDVGYKYTHVAGGDMFNWDSASATAGATGTQGRDNGFSSQEVRVGLRYELW